MSETFELFLRRVLGPDAVRPLDALAYEITLDDVSGTLSWAEGRVSVDHLPQLAFHTIPLDGFVLTVSRSEVWRTRTDADVVAFDVYALDANDPGMSQAWLDIPARTALARALTLMRPDNALSERLEGVTAKLEHDRVLITPPRRPDAYLALVIRAGLTLAQRPRRLADELRLALGGIGATFTGDEWRLDDRCVAVFVRGAATVQLDWRRRLDGEPKRKALLRTRLRAHGPDAPASIDAAWLQPRLAALAPLVKAANAAAITAARGEVTLIWNGLVRTPEMLAPGLELLCRLVAPLPSAAPMR